MAAIDLPPFNVPLLELEPDWFGSHPEIGPAGIPHAQPFANRPPPLGAAEIRETVHKVNPLKARAMGELGRW